ncbi:MAG: twin-arginine translocase TatA/TatE family subunit [Desulfofustis sp.]|nr:twin-arginine translocase TatA/TatE family subunit [Desulfofustis sp.]
MFGIGLPEMILIMALALIVVGPDKLPELARSVAKGVLELKKTVSSLKEDLADENPFDAVKPELEEAADSIKKQLGEATPDGFTGIVKDLEEGLQEVIDKDGTVIPVSTDEIIKTVAGDPGADQSEKESSDPTPEEESEIRNDRAPTAAGESENLSPDKQEKPRSPDSSA